MLNFSVRHGAATIKAKRGVAIMTKNAISEGESKVTKISIMLVSLRPSVFFAIASGVIERKKFDWLRSAGLPVMIARTGKPSIGDQCGETKLSVVPFRGLKFFLSPCRITTFFVPFVLRILSFDFSFFSRRTSFVRGIHTPNHRAGVATEPRDFSVTLKSFFTSWANKFTDLHLSHGGNTTQYGVSCQ